MVGRRSRTALVLALAVLGLATAGWAFWREDLRYSLPTPRPVGLVQPAVASRIDWPPALAAALAPGRPALLHFANPDCPCSRFNLPHLEALVHAHGGAAQFVVVVEGDLAPARALFAPLGAAVAIVPDEDGALAKAAGVYSTPQAVVLDAAGLLRYRGNYNVSRYCTDPSTEFARLALEAVLAERQPALPQAAAVAIGCELPSGRP